MLILIIILFTFIIANDNFINAGPMAGYSTKREVALWIQTTGSVNVRFEYWEATNPTKIFSTNSILTNKDD